MIKSELTGRVKERTIIVLLLVLLPLLSPLMALWSHSESYWFSPYLIWAVMIIAAFLLQRSLHKEPHD